MANKILVGTHITALQVLLISWLRMSTRIVCNVVDITCALWAVHPVEYQTGGRQCRANVRAAVVDGIRTKYALMSHFQ